MKILHLIYDDLNNPWLRGGGAYATFEINKRLAKRHEVTVVTGGYPGAKDEDIDGIKFIRTKISKHYLLSRIYYSFYVKKIVKQQQYDILIDDFSPFSPSFSYKYTNKPIVVVMRNFLGNQIFKKYMIFGIWPYINEKKALKNYNEFICYSRSMKIILKENIEGKQIRQFRRGLELPPLLKTRERYILFLGRISIYQKGLDILLKAYSKLKTHYKLVIAGDGTSGEINKLRQAIKNSGLDKKVSLIGHIRGIKKYHILADSIFIVMPSRYESWGNVAIEAAAMNKPIIGSDIDGLRDSIKHDITGILVPVGNIDKLAVAMKNLLEDANRRRRLSKGREWAITFDINKCFKEQEKYYEKVIQYHKHK